MASTRLTRTVGTQTDNHKFTFSCWVKRAKITYSDAFIVDGRVDASNRFKIAFNSGDVLEIWNSYSGSDTFAINTNRKFRDTFAWYHIVLAVDTTDSTAGDRVKLYINGVRETSFSSSTNPPLNDAANCINESGTTINIGAYYNNTYGYEGCMSHFHFCDGTALAPTVFGETDSTTGEWKINANPSFTLGNNGFTILKDGNTITDQSSNSNDFSLGSGTLTKTEDCPDNVFATLNNLNPMNQPTLTNGNNTLSVGSNNWKISPSTLAPSSGKWYVEHKVSANSGYVGIGIIDTDDYSSNTNIQYSGETANSVMVYSSTGQKWINDANTSYGDSYTTNDIIGVAMDLDNNKVYFSKNGTWMNSGNPESGATGTGAINIPTGGSGEFYILPSIYNATVQCNFGNGYFGTTAISSEGTNASGIGKFEYDVPTGYTALSTKGLNL